MELGVHLSSFDVSGGSAAIPVQIAAAARAAEDGGATLITLMDHWFQMESLGGPARPMLEGYTALGFLAGRTERIALGLLVTGVTYRHPGLLAKTVSTLDVLSGGRAQLGLGAAWYEREHRGLGVAFPPLSERYERLEETLQICAQMWDIEQDGPYEGRHYQLAETLCLPQPLRRPPVMIGGSGERKTLRLVARYADACNLFASSPGEIAHKLEVLRGHCADAGRDPRAIRVTIISGLDPAADPDGFVSEMAGYADVGVEQVMVSAQGPDLGAWVERAVAVVDPLGAMVARSRA